jgi:hypothetical protein
MRIAACIAFVAGVAIAGPASACTVPSPPANEQVRAWLATKPKFDAVVDVEVVATSPTPFGGWTATARRSRIVSGRTTSVDFTFGEPEGVVSSCGSLFAPARTGEAWRLFPLRRVCRRSRCGPQ